MTTTKKEEERRRKEGSQLTFDIEVEDVALRVAFAIHSNATIATGAVTTHALQHQTL